MRITKNNTHEVWLHKTCVATIRLDGSVTLNSGGWRTVTTKRRMNEVLAETPWRVWSVRGTWYVFHNGIRWAQFTDGIIVPACTRHEASA